MNLLKPQQDSEPEEALETAMAMVASASLTGQGSVFSAR